MEAPAGALEAWEAGALEATDLGAMLIDLSWVEVGEVKVVEVYELCSDDEKKTKENVKL